MQGLLMHSVSRAVSSRTPVAGFSIIELMVVMAIVLVLSILIGAGVSHTRWEALKSGSSNNLKQLYMAATLYSGQYDGRHPIVYRGRLSRHPTSGRYAYVHYSGEGMQLFKDQVLPSTKGDDVFFSPTDPFARKNREGHMMNHSISSYDVTGDIRMACKHQPESQPCSPLFEKPSFFGDDPAYLLVTMSQAELKTMPHGYKVPQSSNGDWFNLIDFDCRAEWTDITTRVP
jgi:prepilin-type N-terminal cleavage/methylation domain-containing protein